MGRRGLMVLLLVMLLALPVAAEPRIPTQIVPDAPTSSLVASRVIATTAHKLYAIIVLNTSGSQQYIQVHETTSLPANGAAPKIPSIPVAAGAAVVIDVAGPVGLDLAAITICNSSTAATKTIGSADCMISAVISAD